MKRLHMDAMESRGFFCNSLVTSVIKKLHVLNNEVTEKIQLLTKEKSTYTSQLSLEERMLKKDYMKQNMEKIHNILLLMYKNYYSLCEKAAEFDEYLNNSNLQNKIKEKIFGPLGENPPLYMLVNMLGEVFEEYHKYSNTPQVYEYLYALGLAGCEQSKGFYNYCQGILLTVEIYLKHIDGEAQEKKEQCLLKELNKEMSQINLNKNNN
jgi:hypothetical protein